MAAVLDRHPPPPEVPGSAADPCAVPSRIGRLRRRLPLAKLSKSMAVSLTTTALSAAVLSVLVYFDLMSAGWSNVVATVCGIGPSFALNRRWVWQQTGRSDLRRQVLPFWIMCLLSLAVSTVVVSAAGSWAIARSMHPTMRTLAVLAASTATFASLWVVQFLVLDRVLLCES